MKWQVVFRRGIKVDRRVIHHSRPGAYLDSEEVMAQASLVFTARDVLKVIPVANPFLHLAKCRQLVAKAGFTPVRRKIGWIGFCPESIQWWTRGPIRLLAYAVIQKLFGRRGR